MEELKVLREKVESLLDDLGDQSYSEDAWEWGFTDGRGEAYENVVDLINEMLIEENK